MVLFGLEIPIILTILGILILIIGGVGISVGAGFGIYYLVKYLTKKETKKEDKPSAIVEKPQSVAPSEPENFVKIKYITHLQKNFTVMSTHDLALDDKKINVVEFLLKKSDGKNVEIESLKFNLTKSAIVQIDLLSNCSVNEQSPKMLDASTCKIIVDGPKIRGPKITTVPFNKVIEGSVITPEQLQNAQFVRFTIKLH